MRRHKGPSPKSLDLDLGPIKTLPKVQLTQGIEYKSTLTHSKSFEILVKLQLDFVCTLAAKYHLL